MLVLAYDRRMETTVYATAAVAGRPQVSHCSGRPSILHPLGANLLGGAPIRLTATDEDGPFRLHACASVAAMLSWLDLIMAPTARTKSAGSSHGGPTGRGVVRQAHWLTTAPF